MEGGEGEGDGEGVVRVGGDRGQLERGQQFSITCSLGHCGSLEGKGGEGVGHVE